MINPTDILLADDHALFREGLVCLLKNAFPDVTVHEANDAPSSIEFLESGGKRPDLILLDLSMPGMEDYTCLKRILELADEAPVVMLSAFEDTEAIRDTIVLGARGYILKSFAGSSLKTVLSLILSGETFVPSHVLVDMPKPRKRKGRKTASEENDINPLGNLTRRQIEVLELIMAGQTNKYIARSLGIFESTVKAHVQAILTELKAENRTQAAIIAREHFKGATSPVPVQPTAIHAE